MVSAFINLHDFSVTHHFFYRIFTRIAIATHYLNSVGGNLHCYVSSIAFSHSSFFGIFHTLIAHPAAFLNHQTSGFNFDSHVSQHALYQLEGSDRLTKLTAFFSVFNCAIESSLCQTYGYSAYERTSCVEGCHSNTEAFTFTAYAVSFRNNNVLKDNFASVGRTDTHFVFFFTNGQTRSVFRNDKRGQTTNTAGFTGVSKYQEHICDTCIGDKDFGTVQSVGAVFFIFFSAGGNATSIRTCARFGQSKSSQATFVENVAVHLFLFFGTSNQYRSGSQGVSSQGSCNTCTTFTQFFINSCDGDAVQARTAKFFGNDKVQKTHFVSAFNQTFTHVVLFVHFMNVRGNFLFYELSHHLYKFKLFFIQCKIHFALLNFSADIPLLYKFVLTIFQVFLRIFLQ